MLQRIFLLSLTITITSMIAKSQVASEVCALNIGTECPSAKVQQVDGTVIDLKEYCADQPTVLVFYRGGWCPYCTDHLAALNSVENEIKEMGYNVVAISPDDVKTYPEFLKKEKLNYTLISDYQDEAMKAFGVAFHPSEKRIGIYSRVMKKPEENLLVPVPAIFVIKDGVILYRYVNPNYSVRISNDMLIAALKSLKK